MRALASGRDRWSEVFAARLHAGRGHVGQPQDNEVFLALVGPELATLIQSRMSAEDARDFALEILRMSDEAKTGGAR